LVILAVTLIILPMPSSSSNIQGIFDDEKGL
jgi:hypothetical protein